MSDIADYTAYTSLFAPLANQGVYPDIYVTADHDDDNTLSVPWEYLSYSKCKTGVLKPGSWFTYKFHPTPNFQVYLSAVSTGYGISQGACLNCAYASIPHYGLKVGVFTPGLIAACTDIKIEIQLAYNFVFKNAC